MPLLVPLATQAWADQLPSFLSFPRSTLPGSDLAVYIIL